jgi:hypothetical protein
MKQKKSPRKQQRGMGTLLLARAKMLRRLFVFSCFAGSGPKMLKSQPALELNS